MMSYYEELMGLIFNVNPPSIQSACQFPLYLPFLLYSQNFVNFYLFPKFHLFMLSFFLFVFL